MTQDETMHLLSKFSSMDTGNSWASSPVDLSLAHHTSDQITSSGVILSLARSTSSTPPSTAAVFAGSRKQREFTPDCKKDESYWDRRRRNNEAAKRSREKRRISDVLLEQRVLELTRENQILRSELFALKEKFGIPLNHHIIDPNAVNLPVPENNLRGRRNKLLSSVIPGSIFSPTSSNNSSNGPLKHNVLMSTCKSTGSVSGGSSGGENDRNIIRDGDSDDSDGKNRKKCRRSSKEEDSLSGCMLAAYVSASSPLSSSSSLSDSAVGCSSENQPSQSTSPACSVSSSPLASNGPGTPSLPHKLRHKAATRNTCNEVEPPNDHHANTLTGDCTSASSSLKVTGRIVESKTERIHQDEHEEEEEEEENQEPARGKNNSNSSNSSSNSNNNNNGSSISSSPSPSPCSPGHVGSSVREGYLSTALTADATSALLLKEQNYTLTQQLARLACEVASLKTILVPSSPSTNSPAAAAAAAAAVASLAASHVRPAAEISMRSQSASPPSLLHMKQPMNHCDVYVKQETNGSNLANSSACDSSSEENHCN